MVVTHPLTLNRMAVLTAWPNHRGQAWIADQIDIQARDIVTVDDLAAFHSRSQIDLVAALERQPVSAHFERLPFNPVIMTDLNLNPQKWNWEAHAERGYVIGSFLPAEVDLSDIF